MRVETINSEYQTRASYMNGMQSKNMGVSQAEAKKTKDHNDKNAAAHAEPKNTKEVGKEEKDKTLEAIEQANKHLRIYNRRLEYEIHEATNHIMVKVIDAEDDKVIREIPSEKILDMVGRIWDVAGILVDEKR